MRRVLIATAAAMLLVLLVPVSAGAKKSKTVVCHVTGNGSYHAINVSENAVPAHLNHGDSLVGDPVPGMTGYVFGDDCSAEMSGPAVGCYENDDDMQQDLLYIGPVDSATNIQSSNTNDGSCSLAAGSGLALVLAADAVEAGTKCGDLNGSLALGGVSLVSFGWSGFPANAWLCLGTS